MINVTLALSAWKKLERSYTSSIIAYLKTLEHQETTKLRTKINILEQREQYKESLFFEKISKIDKHLFKLTENRETIKINVRNEKRNNRHK